jgi:3-dehydroquinate dehydratase II
MKILTINGPNLNMLGTREKSIYGAVKLDDIIEKMKKTAEDAGALIDFFQSNHEGEIIDRVQQARGDADVIIMNPGGFTHTSVAIRDAILAVEIPLIEVHLSNIAMREEFRKHSYFSDIAIGTIAGFGENSYYMGLQAALAADL